MNYSMSNDNTLTFVLLAGFFIIALLAICKQMATDYIKKHKDELFQIAPTAKECRKIGMELMENKSSYEMYINYLGFNATQNCSSSVVSGAERNPLKYVLKYSNLENDMNSLEKLDFCLEFLCSLSKLKNQMERLYVQIKNEIPPFVRLFTSQKTVPFIICDVDIDICNVREPRLRFLYVSPKGRSSRQCDITIDASAMRQLQSEISSKLTKSGHAKTQRSAMTNDLRNAIKARDNYTCCICGNSVYNEPNLLLEVDHIIPVSKGGKTEASNLQTLCWRCNREKSNN